MPEQFLTESMCLQVLNRDDEANTVWDSLLQYIPTGKITKELCETAAKHSAYALKYMPMTTQKNTGRLCSVYCPSCRKVTDKISFNLLREARQVSVSCPLCGGITCLDYLDGKGASVSHIDSDALQIARQLLNRTEAGGGGDDAASKRPDHASP